MVSVQNLQEKNFSSFSFSLFYIFSWLLREVYLEPGRTSTVQWRFFAKILNFLGPLKMGLWKILQNSQENICVRISFFDNVKLCRSATSLKRQVSAGVTFFAEHHQTTASDYISVSSINNEGRIDKRICKLWYKTHVSIWAKVYLFRSTLQVKHQVSEEVLHRFLKIS